MSDILQEVDEMMRQDRAKKFWDENGRYIIAFIVMTIVFTGAISGYRAWDTRVSKEQTAKVLVASEDENYPANIAEISQDLRGDIRGVALLNGASMFLQQGQRDEAAKLYAQIAADTDIPDDLRALGILMAVRTDAIEDKLSALDEISDKNVWYPYALLERALILANEQDDVAGAIATLESIKEQGDAPQTLINNADNLLHLYRIDAAAENDKE